MLPAEVHIRCSDSQRNDGGMRKKTAERRDEERAILFLGVQQGGRTNDAS